MILYADVLSESKQGGAGGKKGSVAHKWLQGGGNGVHTPFDGQLCIVAV